MNYQPVLHFPDGSESHMNDLSYASDSMRVGDKVVIEGEKQAFRVCDVQHQFLRINQPDYGFDVLKMILTNVMLENWKPKD